MKKKAKVASVQNEVKPEGTPIPTREVLDKELAKQSLRIVGMKDVTVTRESLVKAIAKTGKLPGNEIVAFVDRILKEVICE